MGVAALWSDRRIAHAGSLAIRRSASEPSAVARCDTVPLMSFLPTRTCLRSQSRAASIRLPAVSYRLLDQVGFAERLDDAVVELLAVEALGRLGTDGDGDLARHLREVHQRLPGGIELVWVGGEG